MTPPLVAWRDASTVPDDPTLARMRAAGVKAIGVYCPWGDNPGVATPEVARVVHAGLRPLPIVVPLQPATGQPWTFGLAAAYAAWRRLEAWLPQVARAQLAMAHDPLRAAIDVELGSWEADWRGALRAVGAWSLWGRLRRHWPFVYGPVAARGRIAAMVPLHRPQGYWEALWTAADGVLGPPPVTLRLAPWGPGQRAQQWAGDVVMDGATVDATVADFGGLP